MAGLLALALAALLASACHAHDNDFQDLFNAITQANKNAEGCKSKTGYGSPVTFNLKDDVQLTGPLPPLLKGAVLRINGRCGFWDNKGCVIDGMNKFPIFTAETLVPLARQGLMSQLVINNVRIQNAKGGVFVNMWAQIMAMNSQFVGNVGGVEIGETGSPNGNPPRHFTNCKFVNNVGTVIKADNAIFGLARSNAAYIVRRCQFINNKGLPGLGGGAVLITGAGTSLFENSVFLGNTADGAGGAVYAAATTVLFRGVSFGRNAALKGSGGAVAGVSTDDGDFSSRFCSCSFAGNKAAVASGSNVWFRVENPDMNEMSLTFCNTATAGVALPAAGTAKVDNFQRTMTCLKTC